jgi:predicted ATPase/DNA-binding XRE family transcriptional regulator
LWKDALAELSSFGEWLKRQRKVAGWTQEQLALQLNCSTSALRKLEAEERHPSAQIAERLAEIFDIPQDERTQFFHFARGEWWATPAEAKEDHPWQISVKPTRSNLPATITSLVGRENDIAIVQDYLLNDEIRLVTLIGPPGIGKTRLSIEATRKSLDDFPDGVFFVALAPVDDANLLIPTIVKTLEFVETSRKSALERLKEGIGDKQMLLVLDNLEHLIENVAPLVPELLFACRNLKILTTTREALRLPGEWLYSVPPLDVPNESTAIDMEAISKFPALTLFAERARAVRSDFGLHSDNMQAVTAICAQLDGLPLAIELIAARIRLMSPQDLLERLSSQFVLSADGMRAVSARQKTLHSAIAWSYNVLSAEEQKLFAYLSIFSGGFTLKAAEVIFSRTVTDKTVSDLIASLLDKSLLQRTLDQRNEPRFSMLVTIQQFALERLQLMEQTAIVRDRHLAYFLDLAEQADQHIHDSAQVEWINHLEKELDNFRAALTWAMGKPTAEAALRLTGGLGAFWILRTHWVEGAKWLDQALSKEWDENNLSEKSARARALYRRADAADALDEFQITKRCAESALVLCQELGDRWGIAYSRAMVADHLKRLGGDPKASKSLLEQSLKEFHSLGDVWGESLISGSLAQIFLLGTRAEYFEMKQRAIACARLSGDRYLTARWLQEYTSDFVAERKWDQAEKMLQEAEQLFEEIGSSHGMNLTRFPRAQILAGRGNYEQANLEGELCVEYFLHTGEKNMQSQALALLVIIAELENNIQRVLEYGQRCKHLLKELHHIGQYIAMTLILGRLHYQQGEGEVAKQYMREALALTSSKGTPWWWRLDHVFGQMGALLIERETRLAVQFLALAESFFNARPHDFWDVFRDRYYGSFLSTARAKLSEGEFTAAWEAGLKLTAEEALDLAMKIVEEILE